MFDASFSGSGSFLSHGLALHSKQSGRDCVRAFMCVLLCIYDYFCMY